MIKGLYSAVSAMITNSVKQQTLAHNIANVQTPGFKQVLSTMEDFKSTNVVQASQGYMGSTQLTGIGSLGLGVENGKEYVDFTQGGLESTENPYDLAIQGNGFFRVQTPDGIRYTRDGRLLRDAQNTLVTVDGYPILNDANQPMKLPEGNLSVTSDGTVIVDTTTVGKLGITAFKSAKDELIRSEGNLFTGPAQSTDTPNVQIVQNYLESSNANPSYLTTEMIQVARSYETAQKMVQNQDELLGKAISTLGRIG